MEETGRAWLSTHRWWVVGGVAGLLVVGAGSAGWLLHRAGEAKAAVARMTDDGHLLARQTSAYDLAGAATTLTRLRTDADQARSLTGDPIWQLASWVPVAGRDLGAASTLSSAVADLADSAKPLETSLARLDPKRLGANGGKIDVAALTDVVQALPAVSDAVDRANSAAFGVDPSGLRPDLAAGTRTLQARLSALRKPLADAKAPLAMLPTLLGAQGKRSYLVMLQQDAEARGTGGLMGSFAIVSADRGALTLVSAQPRGVLQAGGPVPVAGVPQELQDLWGNDLTEWAGLNLSPNFPWTGQLVAAGWNAQHPTQKLDAVLGVDQDVVAALLAGTGPLDAGGVPVTAQTAAAFLSKGIYSRFADPSVVDTATASLVQQTFQRLSTGHLDLGALIKAMGTPYSQRRLQLWSAHPDEQAELDRLGMSGAIPDQPGPFAMAVVNNGGGNKLDAYLDTAVHYDPGPCTDGVRSGTVTVTLTNTAPRSGLPPYVSVRSDLHQEHKPNPVIGSNRILLDVYGPVGSQSPLATIDGVATAATAGLDRNHSVWRLDVPINPGQTRTVDVTVVQPTVGEPASTDLTPTLLTQPMVNPVKASTAPLAPCTQ